MVKLKYIGGTAYIVGIPARDLTDFDIENMSVAGGEDVQIVIDNLVNRKPKLYELHEEYICSSCDKKFKSWKALSKHEMKHIADNVGTDEKNKEQQS